MKRILITLIIVYSITSPGFSQLWQSRRLELTTGIGTTHFLSDIGRFSIKDNPIGIKDISIVNTGINIMANARYEVSRHFAMRGDLAYGYLHASDIHGSRKARGFEVYSVIFEPALIGEYYILKNQHDNSFLFLRNKRSARSPWLSYMDLYVYAGLGGALWNVSPNPQLALYITEPRGFTPVIPAGLGVSRNFSGSFEGGFELAGRYALKDNIDGYASSSDKDSYYFLNVTFTWKIRTRRF